MAQDERHFAFLSEALSNVKGFKIASRESLFCDFAYKDLSELRGFTAFRYCLVRADFSDFVELFTRKTKEASLFDALDEASTGEIQGLNSAQEPNEQYLF